MRKKLGLLTIIGLQLMAFCGCWDYRDVNKLNFPLAASYDLAAENKTFNQDPGDEEQMLHLTSIIPNLDPDAESTFRIEHTSGITIAKTRSQKAYIFPGEYSPSAASIILLGEDLTRLGLNNIFEGLLRHPHISSIQNLAVAEGSGESVLVNPTENYPNMGDFLRGFLRQSNQRGFIPAITLHDFEVAQNPGRNPILPVLRPMDKEAEFVGTAIFRKDRMIAKTNLDETRSLMMLRGIKATGYIPFIVRQNGDIFDQGSVNLTNSRRVKVIRDKDQIIFQITVALKGNLVEHQFGKSFTENEDLRQMIEKQIETDVQSDCYKFIQKMQDDYKVDCIDISKYALAKWEKELQDQIDAGFIEGVTIEVTVKMKLLNIGELT